MKTEEKGYQVWGQTRFSSVFASLCRSRQDGGREQKVDEEESEEFHLSSLGDEMRGGGDGKAVVECDWRTERETHIEIYMCGIAVCYEKVRSGWVLYYT